MKDLFIVAKYTFKDMIKRKSFIISTLIILVLIVIGFNIPNIINSIKGEDETEGEKALIVDSQNIFEGTLIELNNLDLYEDFDIKNENITFEDIKNKIEDGDISSAIIITKNNETINLEYIVENLNMIDEIPQELVSAIGNIYTNLQISKLNLTQEQLTSLSPKFSFELKQTEEKEVNGNVFAIMLLSLVLFYAIYFCAYQVSSSITTEKTSKIIETLVTSTTPRTIVLGKTLGIGIAGLLQIILIVAVALASANAFLPEGTLDNIIDISQITLGLALITIIYFILGYSAYALLYALTGSTVSKPEDINSANQPVALIAVVGFYLAYFTMTNPTSKLNIFASIFPISSPFCMPFRVLMGVAEIWEIIASIVILIVTIFIIAKVSIKIYSSAILNYGTKLSLKDIFKIYKDKNN